MSNLRGLIEMPSDGIVLGSWEADPDQLLSPLMDSASSAYPRAQIHVKPEDGIVYFWYRRFDESPARAVFALRRRQGSAGESWCELVAYPLHRTAEVPLHYRKTPPTDGLLSELRERLRQAGISEAPPADAPAGDTGS